jgi:hypothetical protein
MCLSQYYFRAQYDFLICFFFFLVYSYLMFDLRIFFHVISNKCFYEYLLNKVAKENKLIIPE